MVHYPYMDMNKKALIPAGLLLAAVILGYISFAGPSSPTTPPSLDSTPKNVTLSGIYVCLPHIDTTGPQTEECAFGLKADDGAYYAVNFGASAGALEQFQSGAHITAEGFVVIKEALSSGQWAKYDMKGIFTVTKFLSQPQAR